MPAAPSHAMILEPKPALDDLGLLLAVLPPRLAAGLAARPDLAELLEVVLDLGRPPEARFAGASVTLDPLPLDRDTLAQIVSRVGRFGPDNRAGIERTLHRISALRNRRGEVVGLTCRVGRALVGTVEIVRDVIEGGRSALLLGRPGVGKTTLLREAARVLADDLGRRVVVVDTSNEIAGDGDIPHPGIGRARRLQVPEPAQQHAVMIEAVENHMPEVIVIDEIGTQAEALAARTIAERGVQLIATAHGNSLENLLANPTLADLVGGIQTVTLSDEEARRRGTQKTVLERKAPPTFEVLVEIQEKDRFAVHRDVEEVVDRLLRGLAARPEVRLRGPGGEVDVRPALPAAPFHAAPEPEGGAPGVRGTRGTRKRLRIFPYAISAPRLDGIIRSLRLPAVVIDAMADADCFVTVKSQERRLPRAIRVAAGEGRALHVLRAGTVGQLENFLKGLFGLSDAADDEATALVDVEAAIDAVLEGASAVELTPRVSHLRRLQHEAAEQQGLTSTSRGREPFRRVVVLAP